MGFDIAADRKDKKREKKKIEAKAAAKKERAQKRQIKHEKFKAGLDTFKEGYNAHSHVCTQCGTTANPKTFTKGSILIEIAAWLCFLFPGIIYSLWRLSSRYKGCPECTTQTLVTVSSPVGKKLISNN